MTDKSSAEAFLYENRTYTDISTGSSFCTEKTISTSSGNVFSSEMLL